MNIAWINNTMPTATYNDWDTVDNAVRALTLRFEAEHNVSNGLDIGGLIVYSDDIVYDYENFVGWVR